MIESIFSSRVGTKILLHFGRWPYKEFYLNELSKELKIGLGRTKTLLDNYTKEAVLIKRKNGNRLLFKLNPNNQITFEIIRLANFDCVRGFPERFGTALSKFVTRYREIIGNNLYSLVIFGSVAKGTAGKWSDMDIFVIVKTKPDKGTCDKLRGVNSEVSEVFLETPEDVTYTYKDFIENYSIGDDFLINIMKDGIILFDRDDVFSRYLIKGLPSVTKKAIQQRLAFAKQRLDECIENFQKFTDVTASMLSGVSINLSRGILLLNNMIPGSKHEIPGQLKIAGEAKLSGVYKKTRKWFNEVHPDASKDEVWETISFLKEKYRQAAKNLEAWR